MFANLMNDVRYAARLLVRAPLFTLTAALTLAVGTGATIAVFSLVNAVALRPLPYPDADRLVHIQGGEAGRYSVTYPDILDVREHVSAVTGVAAWQGWRIMVRESDGVRSPRAAASVSWNFFDLLGGSPALGRFFTPEDGQPGHSPVVVLSHGLWQREFGGSREVLGESFVTDGTSYTILGVAGNDFVDPVPRTFGGGVPDVWRAHPPAFDSARADRGWVGFWAIGRLRNGVPVAQAQSEVERLYFTRYPGADPLHAPSVVTVREAEIRDIRPTLVVLFVAVGLVLLIGCANVANLLLSRAPVRLRDVAVRTALGASRPRLVAQLLSESIVLSLAGAGAGFAMAAGVAGLLTRLAGAELGVADIPIDGRVVAFAVVVSLITAIAFGLAPALQLTTSRVGATLREGSRGEVSSAQRRRLGRSFVVAEIALAVVLLVGAGLLLRSLWALQRVDPGFAPESKVAVRVGLPSGDFSGAEEQVVTIDRLIERVAALPGVRGAAAITDLPLSGAVNSTVVLPDDRPEPPPEQRSNTLVRAVTPGYLRLMGVPIGRGRAITVGDRAGSAPVAVVNESFVRRWYPGEDPIGRTVTVRGVSREIVGVAHDVKEFGLTGGGDPVLYEPYAQAQQEWMRAAVWLVVDADAGAAQLTADLRRIIPQVHPSMTVSGSRTLASFVDDEFSGPRFRAMLVLLFAAAALGLAAVGVGGAMAYAVAQRSREIGLRIALGARAADVTGMVLGESVRLTVTGLGIGLLGALGTARFLGSFLFGITSSDPAVFAGVALLLGAVAIAAGYLPARRASRVDPLVALRSE